MAGQAEATAALAGVLDPELRRSVVEFGIARGVAVDGDLAVVTLVPPLEGLGYRGALHSAITDALTALDGIARVEFSVTEPTDGDLTKLAARLRGEPIPNPLAVTDATAPQAPRSHPNPFTNSNTRILAVASGKGGVGKSSVTTNLAIALAQRGHSVAAVDADVWGFSMPRMLGISNPPEVIDDLIIPPSAHGVRLISMGYFAREDQAVVWRGPMLHKALEQFLTDVFWDEPDYLLVDMPPGTGDVSLSIAQFLPRAEMIIVTTPQPAAQKVAQRAAAMADKVDLKVAAVIENMSWFRGDDGKEYDIFGSGGGEELATSLGVPLLARIPLVPVLREGGDDGHPITVAHPDDQAAAAFREAAERIDTELAPRQIRRPELRIN